MHHSLKYNHQFFLTGKVRVVDISISCVNHETTASSRCLMFQYSSKIQVKLQFIGIWLIILFRININTEKKTSCALSGSAGVKYLHKLLPTVHPGILRIKHGVKWCWKVVRLLGVLMFKHSATIIKPVYIWNV